MIDEDLLPIANTRFILMEHPAQVAPVLPPPPASESESAMMWRPADLNSGEVERIPLQQEADPEATAAYGAWVGASLLHTLIADARPGRRHEDEQPQRDDSDEPGPKNTPQP